MKPLACFSLIAFIMTACTGRIVMSPLPPDSIKTQYAASEDIQGIIVYRAKPIIEVQKFIHINVHANPTTNDSPMVLSAKCNPYFFKKVVSVADVEHPYRLRYEHGYLESYTFGATLNNEGILIAVSTSTTPDQGKTFQNVASGISSLAQVIPKMAEDELPNCTLTPVFDHYESLEISKPK